ncbi:MAG: SDR family oxidoreductase [Kiritimatiellae bacterium]|nr:SDR family oxidoreductase [Kiritimatiellia bacterium]
MSGRFDGKVVLVTGGSRNTGLDMVERFVREGAKVWTCGSSAASTSRGAEALRARGLSVAEAPGGGDWQVRAVPCDISDAASVAALFDAIAAESGHLDVLVNNAANQGLGHGGPLEMDPAGFLDVFKTNVFGGFRVTQEACRRFFAKQESRGCVVFLSSNTAVRTIRNRTAYCASKGAINSLVHSLALDLGPLGIRVNCCAPGYINTERWDTLPPEKAARRRFNCPLRKEATGADIAAVVAFLASPDAGNITGEILTVDAGCSSQHMPEDCDC